MAILLGNGDVLLVDSESQNNSLDLVCLSETRKLMVERQSSLFANFIPENPIIAASTTPLERRYLRHFFTFSLYSANLIIVMYVEYQLR